MKRLAVYTSSLALAAAGFAFDAGGLFSSGLRFSGPDMDSLDFQNTESLIGWLRTPLNADGSLMFAAQGSFAYEFLKEIDADKSHDYTLDLDLLKFSYVDSPSSDESLVLSLGRFQYYHVTNLVFTQNGDGALIQHFAPNVQLGAYLGYTGLLNQKNIPMLDEYGVSYGLTYDDDDHWYRKLYDFAPPFLVSSFTFNFPYLFFNQTLGFELSAFLGVDGPGKAEADFNRYYLTAGLSGPLMKNLSYSLMSTLGGEKLSEIGNLTQLSFSYYTGFRGATFSLSGTYASGDNGPFEPFRTITSNPATYARYTQEHTALLKAGCSASIKPLSFIYTAAGADIIFSCPDDSISYDGWQWHASAQIQFATDFQIALTGYSYYGDDSVDNNSGVVFRATIAF